MNMKCLKFFIKANKVHGNGISIDDLLGGKKSTSLILINLKLRFEPSVLNLIWKQCAKDPNKRNYPLISLDFGMKNFIVKNTQKKKL
jgi:hypothetical protein